MRTCTHTHMQPEIELKFKIADFNWYTAPLKTKDQYNKIYVTLYSFSGRLVIHNNATLQNTNLAKKNSLLRLVTTKNN